MRCSSDVGKKCQTMLDMCRRYFYCWCCLCVRVQEVFPRHIQGLFSFCSDNVNFIHEIVTFKNIFDIIYTDALPIYYAVYKCICTKVWYSWEILAYYTQLNDIFSGTHAHHCSGNLCFEKAFSSIYFDDAPTSPHTSL